MSDTTLPKVAQITFTRDEVTLLGHLVGIGLAVLTDNRAALIRSSAGAMEFHHIWNESLSTKMKALYDSTDHGTYDIEDPSDARL